MELALALAVLVAVGAVALVVVRQRELARVRAALGGCTARAEAAERSRDELQRAADELGRTSSERQSALDASRARAVALDEALGVAVAKGAEQEAILQATLAELGEARSQLEDLRAERSPEDLAGDVAAACWALLVARVERQWAAGVAAHPDERGVTGRPAEQLAEAVGRELERLREEVGVHAEGGVTGPVAADPLVALLAVGEALAVLAPHAERVRVALDDGSVVVSGDDWSGPGVAVDHLAGALAGTGLLRALEVADGGVELVLGPPTTSDPAP